MGRRPALALLDILRGEGVDRVFGNPGTTELPFLAALAETEDAPEYVLGIHEGAVVSMADGYARATGRPAFVSLPIAAGLANGLIGLLNARRSRTLLVVMAGQQDRRHLQQDPMLSGDLIGLARPAAKAALDLQHARDLPLAVRRAFALAVRPPAGPVGAHGHRRADRRRGRRLRHVRAQQAVPRTQEPSDLVSTLLHVVDEGSGFLTGQTLNVAGGSAYL
ncbi:hypothetical protein GCM10011579_024060 [Streptomyces albiflavescens]|uniref:Thiamine pyrophosphate enzyme N-terminal TPP-binding domain-containing protein n=1 Tax=Streptomyces albiflavescens TaxID=1623582 RepID=A0A917Y0B5_9ACTN|nr:thiamine pyrophosphate-binding protein [Streptomyces albiflavescens]GGN59651.1 hypothetical protein GCM10011579_024060 [Streptomyces albiflavescens]